MILKTLILTTEMYGAEKGQYRCQIEFADDYSKQTINLSAATSGKILEIVGDQLIEASEHLARSIRPAVEAAFNGPALPAPDE